MVVHNEKVLESVSVKFKQIHAKFGPWCCGDLMGYERFPSLLGH